MGLFDHLYHLDWSARYPLQYYYNDGRHVVFDKYEIDMFGNIYNKKMRKKMIYKKDGKYFRVSVGDSEGNRYTISVARAIVSTFHGKPPTLEYTTEHIDCSNKTNDLVCELTWMVSSGQNKNRVMTGEQLTSYVIVRDGIEKNKKEWVKYLENEKNSFGREYTESMISSYAQRKQHGFSYKIYDDLPNEKWYKVVRSDNKMGRWEISDQNRVAYVSSHARNVIDVTRFGLDKQYPRIKINGKQCMLHDVAFEAYYPEEYAMMTSKDIILHKFDNKLDFRPHMLTIGNHSKNGKDAHDNGCYVGTKTARMPCCSYIDGVFEKRYDSQDAAEKYLRDNGNSRASGSHIREALKSEKVLVRYGRTWKRVD